MSVSFSVRYDASLLATEDSEAAPTLCVWTSFGPKKTTKFYPLKNTSKQNLSDPVQISLPLPEPGYERSDDAVWFEAYALTPSHTGEAVACRVGSAFAYLHELPKTRAVLDLAYFNYWNEDGSRRVKGRLEISETLIDESYTRPGPQDRSAFDYVPSQNAFLQAEMENAIKLSIWPYTDAASSAGEALPALDEKNSRVHAPAWNGPTGWKPGATYFVHPGRRVGPNSEALEASMANLFEAVLARHNMSDKTFIRVVSNQLAQTGDEYDEAFTECCDIVGEALCAPSVSMPYIGDSINTASRMQANSRGMLMLRGKSEHGVESFDWAQLRGGGDCEDFARMIHGVRCALQDGTWKSPVLLAAQGVLNCYIGAGILSSVLGAQLSDEKRSNEPYVLGTARDNSVSIGAHMYYQLIPEHTFLTWIRRVNRDLPVEDLRNPLAPTATWREKMPNLVLEGTGMLRTLQKPAAYYATTPESAREARKKAADHARVVKFLSQSAVADFNGSSASIMQLATQIREQSQLDRVPNARAGGFYRDGTHAYTDDFLKRGFPIAEFTWVALGTPDLVPADARPDFSDDPMYNEPEPELAAAPAVHSANWRKPLVGATELLRGERKPLLSSRADRFDYDSDEPLEVRYGLPLTSTLESRPLRNHVGLLAGPPIDSITAEVLATHYRHSKPVPLGGEMDAAEAAYVARCESLKSDGVDVEALEEKEDREIRLFRQEFGERVSKKWQTKTNFTLVNLFISSKYFRTNGIREFIINSLEPLASTKGPLMYGKVRSEMFVPGHKNVVLQLLFDPNKV